jgi:hypothetical protein
MANILTSTYSDLLGFLGISHLTLMILVLVGISVVALIVMLKRMGIILSAHKVVKTTWHGSTILYMQYQGEYFRIGATFDELRQSVMHEFPLSQMLGVYYDDPTRVDDAEECRAVVGILVYETELHKVEAFAAKNKDFRMRRIT